MHSDQEQRARRLPSRPGRWLLGYRKLGMRVQEGDGHLYVLLVVHEDTGAIRATELLATAPDSRRLTDLLYDALLRPAQGSGQPYRPTELVMDDAGLYQELGPLLERLGVQPVWERSLAVLDEMARHLEGIMRRGARPLALVRSRGTTSAQRAAFYAAAGEFYAAAAAFYDADPWEWLGSADPIAVRYPHDAEPIFVMLVAGSTDQPGINVCLTREGLELYMGGDEDELEKDAEEQPPEVPVLIMYYSDASAMAPDDLAAIRKHGWTIRSEEAYPLFFRVEPPHDYAPPAVDDIWRVSAILQTLPAFITTVGFDKGWVHDTHMIYDLPDIYPERTVALTYPYDLVPGLYTPIEPYETLARSWCADPSREPLGLAMATFMFPLLQVMRAEGYAESTIDLYAKAFDDIGWLQCRFGPHDTFSTAIFVGDAPLEDAFRQQISPAKTALERYRRAWRRLVEWARLLETLPAEPPPGDAEPR